MNATTKHKTAKGVQWLSLLMALVAAVSSAAHQGLIPPHIAVYVLAVTNLLSAGLPGLFGKAPKGD